MRKNCGHTKIRRFKGSANARAPRYFATAAQPAASKRRSMWPLTRLPSMSAGRIATLSPGRRCRRTASLTAFPDFRETPSREMAADLLAPLSEQPWDSVADGQRPAATQGVSSKLKRHLVDRRHAEGNARQEDMHVRRAQVNTVKQALTARLAMRATLSPPAWAQRCGSHLADG